MFSEGRPFHSCGQPVVLVSAGNIDSLDKHVHRFAETLRSIGLVVDIGGLNRQVEKIYDCCVLTNVAEPLLGDECAKRTTDAIRRLRPRSRTIACCVIDGPELASGEVQARWQEAGIEALLDFGFRDQTAVLVPSARSLYHFIPNTLTPSELEKVNQAKHEEDRPIPWAFIGNASPHRIILVNQLITRADPRGFVYLPNTRRDAANDLQQPNQRLFESVLQHCRYHVWYSDQQPFRLESERFRLSLLAGCVPIQVVPEDEDKPAALPFDYLVVHESGAADRLRQFNFNEIWERFRADFLTLPNLAESLSKFFEARSLLPSGRPPVAKPKAA